MACILPIELLKTLSLRDIHSQYAPATTAIRVYYGVDWVINSETRKHPKIPTTWLPTYLLSSLKDYDQHSSKAEYLIITDKFQEEEVEGCQIEGMPLGTKDEAHYGEILRSRSSQQ
jgi:hypothetical protein